jgi:ABC-type glycerol-3-phosphate transport system substrate-binding protein
MSAGFVVVVLLLAACGGGSSSTNSNGAPVVLRIMDYSPEQHSFHDSAAAEYNRLHTNVTIQWDSQAQAQYLQALPLAFQSHQAPDIFFYKSTDNPELTMSFLLNQGWIRPLAPSGNPPQSFLNQWPSGLFQEGINIHNGKVYGFPFTDNVVWGPGYMYYSNALFSAAGLDPSKPPTTWNQLYSDCQAIKSKTGKYCLAVPMKGSDFQRIWFPIAGSIMTDQFFDYKNGTFDLNNPLLLQAFSYIQSLYNAGFMVPGIVDKSISRQQIASGQAAIYFDGTWMPSTFQQLGFTDDKFGVAATPYPDNGPKGALASLNTQNVYWVSSQTTHAKEAWDFIQWMTQRDGFFAKGYYNGNFGTLSYGDNAKLLTDPALTQISKIATGGLRVTYPEPLLKCPDLTKSQALQKATSIQPGQEWNIMVNDLTGNKSLEPDATALVNARQQVLTSTLQQESTSGLKVSLSCFQFTNWTYDQNYTGGYPHS